MFWLKANEFFFLFKHPTNHILSKNRTIQFANENMKLPLPKQQHNPPSQLVKTKPKPPMDYSPLVHFLHFPCLGLLWPKPTHSLITSHTNLSLSLCVSIKILIQKV